MMQAKQRNKLRVKMAAVTLQNDFAGLLVSESRLIDPLLPQGIIHIGQRQYAGFQRDLFSP